MQLRGSRTEGSVATGFVVLSQARNRYTFFASTAKKEGFEQIAGALEETATQKGALAKRLYKLLEGGDVDVSTSFSAGGIGKTSDNLKASAAGDRREWKDLYPAFARAAREEGFDNIARVFEAIAVAVRQHEKRSLDLAANIDAGRVFKREGKVVWRCRKCGYLHEGAEAPEACLACAHPRSYFEILGENW